MGEALVAVPLILDTIKDVQSNKSKNKKISSERKHLKEIMAADEKNKANLVQKALAAQRAAYGAGGAGSRSMSEESVLKRMRAEVEQPFDEKKKNNIFQLSKLKKTKRNILGSITKAFLNPPKPFN